MCRLLPLGLAVAACSATTPGVASWMSLYAQNGAYGHLCDKDLHATTCDDQFVALLKVHLVADQIGQASNLFWYMLFTRVGGRAVGALAAVLHACGVFSAALLLAGIHTKRQGVSSPNSLFLLPALVLVNTGSIGVRFCLWSVMPFFPRLEHILNQLARGNTQLGALAPLCVLAAAALGNVWIPVVLVVFALFSLLSAVTICRCTPTLEAHRAELLKQDNARPKIVELEDEDWQAWWFSVSGVTKQLGVHAGPHVALALLLAVAPAWTTIYQGMAAIYGARLLNGGQVDGTIFAGLVSVFHILAGFSVMALPGSSLWSNPAGPQRTLITLAFLLTFASLAASLPSWSAQVFTAVFSQCLLAWSPVLLNTHMRAHFAPGKMELVLVIYKILHVPVVMGFQWLEVLSLPEFGSTNRGTYYLQGCFHFWIGWAAAYAWIYCFYFVSVGLPDTPFMAPREQTRAERALGCNSVKDVQHVLGAHSPGEVARLLAVRSEQELRELIQRISVERLGEVLHDQTPESLVEIILGGLVWQNKAFLHAGNVEMSGISGYLVPKHLWKEVLSSCVDTSKFGEGRAKSLDTLGKEIMQARSSLIMQASEPTKLMRAVEILLLRVERRVRGETLLLAEVATQTPLGEVRRRPQHPGTKKTPEESTEDAISRILRRLGMENINMEFKFDTLERDAEARESTSYPGLVTFYEKQVVTATIKETDPTALARIGLPECREFVTDSKDKKTIYGWVAACQVLWRIHESERSRQRGSPAGSPRGGPPAGALYTLRDQVAEQPPTTETIHSAMVAFQQTKTLIRSLRRRDVAALEAWLLEVEADIMVDAMSDMPAWLGRDAPFYTKLLLDLVPWSRRAELLSQRNVLKAPFIELLKTELRTVQALR